tara:strand:+ start:7739 stop:8011 length:273 start_codon:yes stop_codon:yes gene_type:complete
MADTLYLGSGKTVTGKHGEFFSISLNLNKVKENPQVVEEFKGTKYIRLNVSKKSEKDRYGKDVVVTWAQYKEETDSSVNNKEDNKVNLPF